MGHHAFLIRCSHNGPKDMPYRATTLGGGMVRADTKGEARRVFRAKHRDLRNLKIKTVEYWQ